MKHKISAVVWGVLFLLLASCEFGIPPDSVSTPPKIAYASPVCDTVGLAASHPVVSTGGLVNVYHISPPPHAGLAFDTLTGLVSGSPQGAYAPVDHVVIAIGPDGRDTAVLRMWAVPAPSSATLPPSLYYESPVIDTVGKPVQHPVFSLGGQVTSYALLSPLPAGLTLNAFTGLISGTPTGAQAYMDYRIVATGPGGKDTATLRLAAALRPSQQQASARPSIAYDSPVDDTVGKFASHPPISLGGKVTSYSVIVVDGSPAALPDGLTLDPVTGVISGTPAMPNLTLLKRSDVVAAPAGGYGGYGTSYAILATGPGGKDTAEVAITIYWYEEITPVDPEASAARINLNLNLGASPGVTLSRLIVTMTSNLPSDTVIRDTITAGAQGFQATTLAQSFTKTYKVKPLRHWTVTVKTIGQGVTVHADSVITSSVLAGETRTVTMTLQPVFSYGQLALSMVLATVVAKASASTQASAGSLSRMMVSLSDGTSANPPIRDTILAGTQGFSATLPSQNVMKNYTVRALRNWQISVQVRDVQDSLRYSGTAMANSLLTGETRAVSVFVLSSSCGGSPCTIVNTPLPNPLPKGVAP